MVLASTRTKLTTYETEPTDPSPHHENSPPTSMAGTRAQKNRKNRRRILAASTPPPLLPPPKTKEVPRQPSRSFRSPSTINDMLDSSLPLSSPSPTRDQDDTMDIVPETSYAIRPPPPNQLDFFAGLDSPTQRPQRDTTHGTPHAAHLPPHDQLNPSPGFVSPTQSPHQATIPETSHATHHPPPDQPNLFSGLGSPTQRPQAIPSNTPRRVSKRQRSNTNPEDPLPPIPFCLVGGHTDVVLPPAFTPAPATVTTTPATAPPIGRTALAPPSEHHRVRPIATTFRPYPTNPPSAQVMTTSLPIPDIPDTEITGFAGDNPLIGMDLTMANDWSSLPGPKALAYLHDASFSDEAKLHEAVKLEDAITEFLEGQRPRITAPRIADNFENKGQGRRPWCFLVSSLSEENIDIICSEKFIANRHAALHVIRFNPPPSHYIGRIRGITYDAEDRETVEELIRSTITNSNTKSFIKEFTATNNNLIPKTVIDSGCTVEWIIDSVRAYHVQADGEQGKDYSQWRWYIFTPTDVPKQTQTWTKTLLELSFNAKVFGWGDTKTDYKCSRCKSTNHSDKECPFSMRSNFVQPSPPIPRQDRRTRGTRGGTRGAGWGGRRQGRKPTN